MEKLTLKDQVPSRCYYYLLDWNESNEWRALNELFGVCTLKELSVENFWKLFDRATKKELENNSKEK